MSALEPIVVGKEDRVINPIRNVMLTSVNKELQSYRIFPRVRFFNAVHYEKKEGLTIRVTPRLKPTTPVNSIKSLSAGFIGRVIDEDGGIITAYIYSNIDNFQIVDSVLFYPDGRILIAVDPEKLEGIQVIDGKYVRASDLIRYSISMKITYPGNEKRNRTYGLKQIDPKIAFDIVKAILDNDWPKEEIEALQIFADNFFFRPIDKLNYDTTGKIVVLNLKEVSK